MEMNNVVQLRTRMTVAADRAEALVRILAECDLIHTWARTQMTRPATTEGVGDLKDVVTALDALVEAMPGGRDRVVYEAAEFFSTHHHNQPINRTPPKEG